MGEHETPCESFLLEFMTRDGKVSERYATYEEARRRLEQFPEGAVVGLPLIFRELADGSERVVRGDGKPLQFHRVVTEGVRPGEEPLPLAEGDSGLLAADGTLRIVPPRPPDFDDDGGEPIPLAD